MSLLRTKAMEGSLGVFQNFQVNFFNWLCLLLPLLYLSDFVLRGIC